jgi:predicted nucleic acid-binding protein
VRVVVDANVIAAAAIRPQGRTARQLERVDVEWFGPAFLLRELQDHRAELAARARLSAEEWEKRLERAIATIHFIPDGDLAPLDGHALVNRADRVDPDDAAYVATVVVSGADFLWTLDKRLQRAFPGLAVAILPASAATHGRRDEKP